MHSLTSTRFWFGLAGATILSSALAVVIINLWSHDFSLPDDRSVETILRFIVATYVLIGLPFHLLCARMGWTRVWPYALAGAAVGLALGLFLELGIRPGGTSGFATSSLVVALLTGHGAFSGAAFWTLGVRGTAS